MKKIIQCFALACLTLGAKAEELDTGFSKNSEKNEYHHVNDSSREDYEVELPYDYTLLPITWDAKSTELTLDAKLIIDQSLIIEANKRKNSIIEIGSHTNSRGSAMKNQTLSEKRAKSIVDYMISKGINQNRLIAIGYGETQLKNECKDGVICSEAEHSLNSRIEFKVF